MSSREEKHFRDGIAKICATKISAGVSTGIGDHEEKYEAYDSNMDKESLAKELENDECGDEQFDIADKRSFDQMYKDMSDEGLQPVLNDYVYV